jgi:hypothetical protein
MSRINLRGHAVASGAFPECHNFGHQQGLLEPKVFPRTQRPALLAVFDSVVLYIKRPGHRYFFKQGSQITKYSSDFALPFVY